MIIDDKELIADFICESNDGLADIENDLLTIESAGDAFDIDLVNTIFRAVHSVKGAAGFLGLTKINELAHSMEHLLDKYRSRTICPSSERIEALLRAADTLKAMINNIAGSNDVDISYHVQELKKVAMSSEVESKQTSQTGGDTTTHTIQQEIPSTTSHLDIPPQNPTDHGGEDSTKTQGLIHTMSNSSQTINQGMSDPNAGSDVSLLEPGISKNEDTSIGKTASALAAETNLRVPVHVLDRLMNLAGELVLCRNQLLQIVTSADWNGINGTTASLDLVTSELQEAIMQTRLQPIGNVFNRFPRIVRDLAHKLGKECELVVAGKEVEVDKSIIEAIGDPLTHLVRNAVDHGIESPSQREAKGKSVTGTIKLTAHHQAGKVCIDIEDDGAGMDPRKLREKAVEKGILSAEQAEILSDRDAVRLIFHPGFSMAAKVTDVSGRGVGMDVVRTNIERLGGTVDVISEVGRGTEIHVTLPLTLAIIPSLLIRCGGKRFAIPQVNVAEIVRVRSNEKAERIGSIKNAAVLRLRGTLLPLIRLSNVLASNTSIVNSCHVLEELEAIQIIVVESGKSRFGVIVDSVEDSEEIVVKALGPHLKDCHCFAGATILGDGSVALILDVSGLASLEELRSTSEKDDVDMESTSSMYHTFETQNVLLFNNTPGELFAIPMAVISRIERIRNDQIDSVGGQKILQYRGTSLPLLELSQVIRTESSPEKDRLFVVVFDIGNREVGLIAPDLVDIRDVSTEVDTITFKEPGVAGALVVDGQTARLLDIFEFAETIQSEWFSERKKMDVSEDIRPFILLAEDSPFFRKQVSGFLESAGYTVVCAEDGQAAWDIMLSGEYAFDLLVTDIEMPNLNGLDLCRRVKDHPTFSDMPVIALTSLAGEEDFRRGEESGIDDYQVKFDRERTLASVAKFMKNRRESQMSGQPMNNVRS